MASKFSMKDLVIILLAALHIFWWVITGQREGYEENRIPNPVPQLFTEAIDNKTKPTLVERKERLSQEKSKAPEKKDEKENICNSTCHEYHWTHGVNQTSASEFKLISTCSDPKAIYRGQNVVSFTYYDPGKPGGKGNKKWLPIYYRNMQLNIVAIRKYYPGFVMRVYTDAPLEGKFCELACKNPDFQWCDIRKTPKFGDLSKMYFRTWRYLPLGDPTVNIFLSRELDSVVNQREFYAMRDWFRTTTKPISVMRDHTYHDDPILGGTWGAINSLIGETLATRFQSEIISQSSVPKPNFYLDQRILDNILWPLRKMYIVGYDSYVCKQFNKQHEVRPFPVQRNKPDANGMQDDLAVRYEDGRKVRIQPCPVDCRPTYGKNWTYC